MKKLSKFLYVVAFLGFFFNACGQKKSSTTSKTTTNSNQITETSKMENLKIATFGAGCFWCVEAVYQQLDGVEKVVSGYAGGKIDNPSYKDVCSGTTGHAEVCQIYYDPKKITFEELLEAFWASHDPTTLNKQGADVGTQYRSVVFYSDENQKQVTEEFKKKLNDAKAFKNPIVTEISPLPKFFVAEDYHQNYYNLNGEAPYCQYVVRPKLDKFRKVFAEKLKK
jgi:peptide-methionine (S)-S-oxide reductase